MKSYLKNIVINAIKPSVPKTKLQQKTSELKKLIQRNKGSKAKLDQTIFEINNPKFKGKKFTFAPKGKAVKESDRKKQIMKYNNKVIGKMVKKAFDAGKGK